MTERINAGGLRIAKPLYDLVRDEIIAGTGIDPEDVWNALGAIVHELGPRNAELLKKRDALQSRIDAWYLERKDRPRDLGEYKRFLGEIGYLLPEGEDFQVTTTRVDPEIARQKLMDITGVK